MNRLSTEAAKLFCDQTLELLEAGDFEQALALAESGLQSSPDEGRLWEVRGIVLGCRRADGEAITSLERASSLVPLSILAQIVLAACYVRARNLQLAECIYEFLASRDDVPAHLLGDLANGLDQVGRPELALGVCGAAVQRVPECDTAFFAMACYMTRLNYPLDQIVHVMEQAFGLRPDKILYRVDLVLLLAQCDRLEEAYEIATAIPVADVLEIHCPPRLIGLLHLFRQMNDYPRFQACEARIVEITGRHEPEQA